MSDQHPSNPQPPDFNMFGDHHLNTGLDGGGGGASVPVRDTPDRGTRRSRLIATIIAVLCIAGVMTVQQIGALSEEPVDKTKVEAPGPSDQYLISSGIMVKMGAVLRSLQPGGIPPMEAESLTDSIRDGAATPVDKFRALIVSAEIAGKEKVLGWADTAVADGIEYAGSEEDLATLRVILEGRASDLTAEQRDALITRHGYYGRLALTLGLPDTDPARQPFLKNSAALLAFLVVLGGLVLLLIGCAVAAFIVMMVKMGRGRVRASFVPPAPGGSVYLEMVAILAGLFLLMQLVGGLAVAKVFGEKNTEGGLVAALAMQWLLLPVIFWPLLRGVSWKEHARRIGWTRGEGFFREVWTGVWAYLAALPVFAFVVLLMVLVMVLYELITHGGKAEPPQVKNEILDIMAQGKPLVLIMFFLLAAVWAPIVEESVFRGALFRHMRGVTGVVLSALVSALAFSVMHGYAFFMLAPVFTLGLIFALMREWRTSLVASITAHALHNGTLLIIVITLLTLARPE